MLVLYGGTLLTLLRARPNTNIKLVQMKLFLTVGQGAQALALPTRQEYFICITSSSFMFLLVPIQGYSRAR